VFFGLTQEFNTEFAFTFPDEERGRGWGTKRALPIAALFSLGGTNPTRPGR